MLRKIVICLMLSVTLINAINIFSIDNFINYSKYFRLNTNNTNKLNNELWTGIIRDCTKKLSFSCIQKNAYTYLDNTIDFQDNITVFDGFTLKKNHLNYDFCTKNCDNDVEVEENLVDSFSHESRSHKEDDTSDYSKENEAEEEQKSPLEEVTSALRDKTVKFLATRDYEIQLPEIFFQGSKIKISPKEVDEGGALIRIDFGPRGVAEESRIFKKIRKFIQNRLLMSFLALLLIIKLIKIKFMFIVPFLFGIGTAKKIFLKILLFFIPAFAHVFKLCSSYYNDHVKYYHHHHHRVAHHHHHVPVPVPIPAPASPPPSAFYSPHPHDSHPTIYEDDFQGYDYAHPHIQLRKDIEELKEWGIDTMWDGNEDQRIHINGLYSPTNNPAVQYPLNIKTNSPVAGIQPDPNLPSHAQSLAYNGYLDNKKLDKRISVQSSNIVSVPQVQPQVASINPQYVKHHPTVVSSQLKQSQQPSTVFTVFPQNSNVVQTQRVPHKVALKSNPATQEVSQSNAQVTHQPDDTFYGPILQRLDDIFSQLKIIDEKCKERIICSMYKTPASFSPHSNLVSNELSRDPQELKRRVMESTSSQRFYRYINAARVGQDGGDCQQIYPCYKTTE